MIMRHDINPVAKAMAKNRDAFRQQIVRDRTKYTRKTKHKSLEMN